MVSHELIPGNQFTDRRGSLSFCNDFDMSEVRRFYEIKPASIKEIRAWQAHQEEKKWFYCLKGSFVINLIRIDAFSEPSGELIPEQYVMHADRPAVLKIPGGFANGFRALEDRSSLMVFSNFTLDQSEKDDYRYSLATWEADWK